MDATLATFNQNIYECSVHHITFENIKCSVTLERRLFLLVFVYILKKICLHFFTIFK